MPAFLSDDKKTSTGTGEGSQVLRKLDLTKGLVKEHLDAALGPPSVRGVNLAFGLESLEENGGSRVHNSGAAKYRNVVNLNRGLESLQGGDSATPMAPTENSAKILELLAASETSSEAWEARVGKGGGDGDSLPDETALLRALGLEAAGGGAVALHEKWEGKASGGRPGEDGTCSGAVDTTASLSTAVSLLGLLGTDGSGDVLEAWEVKKQGKSLA